MNNKKVVSSFIWKFMERLNSQLINLIVQIVLARILGPESFGVLAILIVFVNIASIFIQKGLSSSLIRKKTIDKIDCDTSFWAGFAISIAIYIFLFFISPFVAEVYNLKQLKIGLRLISISFLFGPLYCVQNAILVRDLKFEVIFWRGTISATISGVIGITMAVIGMGLWSLIAQVLINQILLCLTSWNKTGWYPGLNFSKNRLYEILSFGGIILLSELLSYTVESIRIIFIGIFYSAELLSYYDRGQMYPSTLMRGIYDTIGNVLLPVFSKNQDNDNFLSIEFKKMISIIMFIIVPIFVGFAASSKSIIEILLTNKWSHIVPYIIVFCFAYLSQPMQGVCRQLIYSKGESKIIFKIEIIKGVISILSLIVALNISVYAISISFLISMYLSTCLMLYYVTQITPIKFYEIVLCISKTFIYSLVMFFAIYICNYLKINILIKLIIQIGLGIFIYMGLAILSKDLNLIYFFKFVRRFNRKI